MPRAIDEQRIFDVTAALFVERGYAGTTTKAIARAAGVNEVTLFRRYGSKAELLRRAIDRQWQGVPLAGLQPSDDLEADLRTIVVAYLETEALRGAIVPALLAELSRGDALRGAFASGMANIAGIAAILQHHQQAGRLRPEPLPVSVAALLGPLLVLRMFQRGAVWPEPPQLDPVAHVRGFLYGRATAA